MRDRGTQRDREGQQGGCAGPGSAGTQRDREGHNGTVRTQWGQQEGLDTERDTTPACLQPTGQTVCPRGVPAARAQEWLLKLCCTFSLLFHHPALHGLCGRAKSSHIFMDKMLGMQLSSWQIHAKQLAELELAPLTCQLCAPAQITALLCLKQMEQ